MGEVIKMHDFRNPWKELVSLDSETSMLQVYLNDLTGEVEILQMNDDGEAIRTQLSAQDASLLAAALAVKSKRDAK